MDADGVDEMVGLEEFPARHDPMAQEIYLGIRSVVERWLLSRRPNLRRLSAISLHDQSPEALFCRETVIKKAVEFLQIRGNEMAELNKFVWNIQRDLGVSMSERIKVLSFGSAQTSAQTNVNEETAEDLSVGVRIHDADMWDEIRHRFLTQTVPREDRVGLIRSRIERIKQRASARCTKKATTRAA